MQLPERNAAGNAVLAALLAQAGLTQDGLADAVNGAVADATGVPGRASDRWVRMLLDGSVRWPRRHYRHALATVFGVSVEELGFVRPVGATVARHETATVTAAPARLSAADIDRLRVPLGRLVARADGHGAAMLAPQAARHAAVVQDALQGAVVSERVERAAYVLIGDYLAAAGWFALDGGDLASAQRHLDAALRAAGIARDGSLQAYVWSVTEKRARLSGDYGQALAVARTGRASAAARSNPQVRAVFYALAAMNLARHQDVQAQRSLERAVDALDRAPRGGSAGRWGFANQGFIAAAGASVSLTLGQLRQAERYGQQAVQLTRSHASQTRNHATRRLSLARIYLEMRDLEAACAHASTVLNLAHQVHSGHLADRLDTMHHTLLNRWPTAAVVRDWSAQYEHWRQQTQSTS